MIVNPNNKIKIVINDCYGGFGLSEEALKLYNENRDQPVEYDGDIKRDDKKLVKIVEELGDKANGDHAKLTIVEIPSVFRDVYTISDYDGVEDVDCNLETLLKKNYGNLDIVHMSEREQTDVLSEILALIKL